MSTTTPATEEIHTDVINGALLQRLQPDPGYVGYISDHVGHTSIAPTSTAATKSSMATIFSHILPTASTAVPVQMPVPYSNAKETTTSTTTTTAATTTTTATATVESIAQSPPSIANLVASSSEDLSNFRDVTFDIFDDDDDLFGSPLAFDDSENGLWNGRFVPPPPRPPFLVEEAVLSDGLTTCDLCSWAMPTKSTFIFDGTIEKASELGWPLTLIIVSLLSALFGAIIMVIVVRCRRKKASNNRNATHVQWWSRKKRSTSNNNHLRRSNIYTAHPVDSIRGLQQPSLSAASSLTAITAMGGFCATNATIETGTITTQHLQHEPEFDDHQQQQHQKRNKHQAHQHSHRTHAAAASHMHHPHHPHLHHHHQHHRQLHFHHRHPQHLFEQQQDDYNDFDHEYHQPQELHLHQRQLSSSLSTSSASSSTPSLNLTPTTLVPIVQHMQLHQHQHQSQPQPQSQQRQQSQQYFRDDAADLPTTTATSCHWPNTTMLLAS